MTSPCPQLAWRNTVRFSPAVLRAPAGQPSEWQIMLRLLAIVTGRGAAADLAALDDELTADDVRRTAGRPPPPVLAAVAGQRGPERVLDLALRGGPYDDRFGMAPGGLTLARLKASPAGIDLGALKPGIGSGAQKDRERRRDPRKKSRRALGAALAHVVRRRYTESKGCQSSTTDTP